MTTETKSVTLCVNCEHFWNLEPNSVRNSIWYNHLCLASPLPPKLNTYDGSLEPQYENCRNINKDGRCQKFSAL
jgi:hypothetical protein